MSWLEKILGSPPFGQMAAHAKQVHECVKLLTPLTTALIDENHDEIERLRSTMSAEEHKADEIKNSVRTQMAGTLFLGMNRNDFMRLLSLQDDVADAAEDFAVILTIRKTRLHPELHDEFRALVAQSIHVGEHLLDLCEEVAVLAESSFQGKESKKFLDAIQAIGQEEWQADKLARHFAKHFYAMEESLNPTTLMFYDKYCTSLGKISNRAEKTAKFLRQIILSQ